MNSNIVIQLLEVSCQLQNNCCTLPGVWSCS